MADKQVFIDAGPKKPKLPHSNFDVSHVNNMTARFGRCYPVYCRELPAGARLTIKPSMAFDMMPLVYPIQTNVRAHLKFYKVPMRILWDKYEDFMSAVGSDGLPNNSSQDPYVMPYIKRSSWCSVGSLAESFGVCSQEYTLSQAEFVQNPVSYDIVDSGIEFSFNLSNTRYNLATAPYNGLNVFFVIPYYAKSVPIFSESINVEMYTRGVGHGIRPDGGQLFFTGTFKSATPNLSPDGGFATSRNAQSGADIVVGGVTYHRYNLYFSLGSYAEAYQSILDRLRAASVDGYVRVRLSGGNILSLFPGLMPTSVFTQNADVSPKEDSVTLKVLGDVVESPLFVGLQSYIYHPIQTTIEGNSTVFDSVNGADPLQPINALPFRAYEFIHNYFFRNERVAPFTLDGKPQYNEFITNSGSGADETTPLEFFNALYEYDYFTTCVKEPQFGKAPLVGVTVNDLSDTGILTFQGESTDDSYVVKIPIGADGAAMPLTVYKGTADDTTIHRLNELISFGISINDLRNVSSFQRMLERYQRSGHKYANVVYEFFGTNPPIGDHYPTYLGGFNASMSVQKITNMALSKDAKLGEFAGQGRVSGKGRKIRCFCSEPCYVIGILYFSVTPVYSQYLPKHFIKSELLDYLVNPDFATLSPQPVYKKELAPTQVDTNSFNAVFGYQRPYADYVSSFDEAHGLFKTSMSNFLLQRKFLIPPSLNRSFIEVRSDDLLNIFSVVEDEDKLYGQVYFDARVSLPLPRSYSPRSI